MKKGLVGLAVLGAMAAFTPGMAHAIPAPRAIVSNKVKRGLFNGMAYGYQSLWGTKGAGISMAQQKRAAAKAKNRARNKAR